MLRLMDANGWVEHHVRGQFCLASARFRSASRRSFSALEEIPRIGERVKELGILVATNGY